MKVLTSKTEHFGSKLFPALVVINSKLNLICHFQKILKTHSSIIINPLLLLVV